MRRAGVVGLLVLSACSNDIQAPPDQGVADLNPADLSAGPGSSCALPIDLTHETGPYAASTASGGNLTANTCEDDSSSIPEVYFTYDLGSTVADLVIDVVVDAQFEWDAVVSGRTICRDISSEVDCADFGGSQHLELLAQTGLVYLIVDGTKTGNLGSAGPFTIQVRQRPIVGMGDPCDPQGLTARCGDDLKCKNSQCVVNAADLECMTAQNLTPLLSGGSTATVDAVILQFETSYYTTSCAFDTFHDFAENIYRIDVTDPSSLTASTDDDAHTDFDTVMALVQGSCDGTELDCNDDVDNANRNYFSRLDEPLLQPGTYYLIVEPSTLFTYTDASTIPRSYRLTVTLAPTSLDAGTD